MTTAAAGTPLERMRFGFVSCSQYEHGYFSAYRHLADENPDVVMFLGDYIYEYVEQGRPTVRTHSDGIEAATLPTYRNRYAQYRLDLDLARLQGRPRSAERLRRQVFAIFRRSRAVPAAPRRRLPGVLRAHAGAADRVSAERPGDAGL
jgi:hypothetical protein